MSKKDVIIVLVLILLIGVIFVFGRKKEILKNGEPQTTFLQPDQVPEKFPTDLPVEANAKISDSYTSKVGDLTQSTRKYESNRTSKQTVLNFVEYFKKTGWTLMSLEQPTETIQAMTAVNNKQETMQITLTTISPKITRIEVSYIFK